MAVTNAADAARVERCARLCAERAWRLASALLRDRDQAYDAVQQAFLVAARKPEQVPADDPWPWFGTVLVHEVRNLRKKRRPLTNRGDETGPGGPMERADPHPAPDRAAERAEDAAHLLAAVDALPVDEREALVLTHLAGLSQVAAAEAAGVPRQTLASRAERGLDTLARRLGREPRAAARALAVVPLVDPAGGLAKATVAWTKAALAVQATAVGIGAASAAGGALVTTTQTAWLAGLVLALGAGFVGGAATEGFGLFEARPRAAPPEGAGPPVGAAQPGGAAPLSTTAPVLEGSAASPAEARARLEAENRGLAERLAAAEAEVLAWKAKAQGPGGAGGAATFTFGEAGKLDAVRETNWATLATAAKVVDDAVVEMYVLGKAGKPVPKETMLRLQENVEKMRTYEYRTIDKLPTAALHNGEFTHPISMTNLVASLLANAGLPLTPEQVSAIEKLGAAFDAQFARLRQGWGKDVPRVRRMLEEYRLKGRFKDDLDAALTAEQRAALLDPAYRGIAGLDLNDPTLMILHSTIVVTGADAAQIKAKLGPIVRRALGLAADAAAPALDGLLDAFVARGLRGVESVPTSQARYYTFAQGLQAGEATAELIDGVLREFDLDLGRDDLLQSPTWYLLRLTTG